MVLLAIHLQWKSSIIQRVLSIKSHAVHVVADGSNIKGILPIIYSWAPGSQWLGHIPSESVNPELRMELKKTQCLGLHVEMCKLSNWRGGWDGLIRLYNKERKKDSEFRFEALQHLEVGRGFPWWLNLPMQETWVWSLIQEDSTCLRATEPVHHNYWACALEPESCN